MKFDYARPPSVEINYCKKSKFKWIYLLFFSLGFIADHLFGPMIWSRISLISRVKGISPVMEQKQEKETKPLIAKASKLEHYDFYTVLREEEEGAGKKGYFLQIAALSSEEDAKADAIKFQQLGLQVARVKVEVNGKIWYRLMSGPYTSLAEAKERKNILAAQHIPALLVMQSDH
jgi:cell division septation protein DedD